MACVAIVTGSSRGIGAATAIRLAKEGFNVCINYLSNEEAASRVAEQARTHGVKAISICADVSKQTQVTHLLDSTRAQLGVPSVLINNAGIVLPQTRVVDMTEDRINKVLTTNVTGYLLCAREAIACMSTVSGGSGGVIVNVSSAAARLGSPGEYIDYAASKGAVDTFTIGLAREVATEGIRVNAVRPGLIYTDMHASAGEPARVDRLQGSIPMKRGGDAEEVAAAIAWLVSEESGYTTGAFIEVSGGR
ncbi:MAG: SDR family oxidoreductase [Pseudomonadota bacterium]